MTSSNETNKHETNNELYTNDSLDRNSSTDIALGRRPTPQVEQHSQTYFETSNLAQASPNKATSVDAVSDTIKAAANDITCATQDRISQLTADVLPSKRN